MAADAPVICKAPDENVVPVLSIMFVVSMPAPCRVMFLLAIFTGVVHMQVPAGTKIKVCGVAKLIAVCTSDWEQEAARMVCAEASRGQTNKTVNTKNTSLFDVIR